MAKDEEKEVKADETEGKKGGKKKLIILLVPVILLIAGAGYWFLLRPKDAAGPVALPEPVPGAVVPLDPITINLAGAHFLKLGMALQPTSTAHEAPDGSKALNIAIDEFSGLTIADLSGAEGRDRATEELVARVKLAYLPHGTDLAVAFEAPAEGGAHATTDTKETAAAADTKKSSTAKAKTMTHHDLETLSGAEAVKLAAKLSVQTDVYDVYLTEFVMQ